MNSEKVRTRFAPSPTGYLHVGGIRTALFAWLIARQAKGTFILRLEDTDKAREVEGSGQHIMDSLEWLGLTWDEGLDKGGDFGPYIQSERLALYKQWAQKLVDNGRAYADPYSPDEVQAFREQAQKAKKPFLYRNHRPEKTPTWNGTQPLRFRSDPKSYTWHDEVMGDMTTGPEVIDDFILIKSDGYPTYNFAHVIDDMLIQITHIIRGQEFLASTPNYLNLYEALEIERPILATVPPVMGPDGNKKLSKRDGAKDILDYAREGYLPEAIINFMASLGWNDGTEQEEFSVDELIEKFSLSRIQRSGARFDERRLLWLNGAHIRKLPIEVLAQKVKGYWPESSKDADDDYKAAVLELIQERLKFFAEIPELTEFFFTEPTDESIDGLLHDPKNKQLKKLSNDDIHSFLSSVEKSLAESDFSVPDIESRLNSLLVDLDTKPGILFNMVRIAISGSPASPPLFDTLSVIGKNKSLDRIRRTLALLS